jgi:hypothetical protein
VRVYPLLSSLAFFPTLSFAQFLRGSVKNSPRLKSLMCMSHQLQTAHPLSPSFSFVSRIRLCCLPCSLTSTFFLAWPPPYLIQLRSSVHTLQLFFLSFAILLCSSCNALTELPESLDQLTALSALNLSGCYCVDAAASVTWSADDADNAESVWMPWIDRTAGMGGTENDLGLARAPAIHPRAARLDHAAGSADDAGSQLV